MVRPLSEERVLEDDEDRAPARPRRHCRRRPPGSCRRGPARACRSIPEGAAPCGGPSTSSGRASRRRPSRSAASTTRVEERIGARARGEQQERRADEQDGLLHGTNPIENGGSPTSMTRAGQHPVGPRVEEVEPGPRAGSWSASHRRPSGPSTMSGRKPSRDQDVARRAAPARIEGDQAVAQVVRLHDRVALRRRQQDEVGDVAAERVLGRRRSAPRRSASPGRRARARRRRRGRCRPASPTTSRPVPGSRTMPLASPNGVGAGQSGCSRRPRRSRGRSRPAGSGRSARSRGGGRGVAR